MSSRVRSFRFLANRVPKGTEQGIVLASMKVGIVVPYSWSFWGAVVEHAELQAAALRQLGIDVRLVIGNRMIAPTLPADSFNTFVMPPAEPAP